MKKAINNMWGTTIGVIINVSFFISFSLLSGIVYGETATINPKPPSVLPQSYNYKAKGKSDPFKPFIERDLAIKKIRERAKPLPISPLQRLSIEQIKIVGIAGDSDNRKAIIEDATGKKIYPIFRGTYIGQNNGRVKEILEDRVVVEEKSKTSKGQFKVNLITIKLHKNE